MKSVAYFELDVHMRPMKEMRVISRFLLVSTRNSRRLLFTEMANSTMMG